MGSLNSLYFFPDTIMGETNQTEGFNGRIFMITKLMHFIKPTLLLLTTFVACSAEMVPGLYKAQPISHKFSKTVDGYFYSSHLKSVKNALSKKQQGLDFQLTPEEAVDYKAGSKTMVVYIPKGYNPKSKEYGIYLHNSPGNKGIIPKDDWKKLMDKHKLIYISPNETKNGTPFIRRVALGIDEVTTIKNKCSIDEKRVFSGGTSGGGHVGMLSQMMYPEVYYGAISHAAQSYLPSGNSYGHFYGLSENDCTKGIRKDRPWVVISGNKDSNYQEIIESSKEWKQHKMDYEFIDIPGMGHKSASGPALEKALIRIGANYTPKVKVLSSTPSNF